jgi:protein-disulfide isomerase
VEFTDFQCPYCARGAATMEKVIQAYPDQIQLYVKNNPLPFHKQAPFAALASLAANEQGKYWEMHDLLFKNARSLSEEKILGFAEEIGLDMEQFKKSLEKQELKDQIEADKKDALGVDARGTPTFFVNGIKLRGAQPLKAFKKVIDEELAKLKSKPAAETQKKDVEKTTEKSDSPE